MYEKVFKPQVFQHMQTLTRAPEDVHTHGVYMITKHHCLATRHGAKYFGTRA